jgi:hypothetical protein
MESQVLEQEDLSVLGVGNSLFNFGSNTVRKESNGLGEEFFELGGLLMRERTVRGCAERRKGVLTTGFKLNFSTLCPSGRPKWDMRTIEAAP